MGRPAEAAPRAGFLQDALQRRPAGHVGRNRQVRRRGPAQLIGRSAASLSHAVAGGALWRDSTGGGAGTEREEALRAWSRAPPVGSRLKITQTGRAGAEQS